MGASIMMLTGCVPPQGYGYAQTSFAVAGPQVAFTFSDGVQGYYESAYGTYVYGDGGYYYRWDADRWVYASYYSGPWQPLGVGVYLPPLLVYGPPPPVVSYRPYFVWWRLHAAVWYQRNHPQWWYRHRFYVRHYALWRDHVARVNENRPGWRPRMRPLFRRRDRRVDNIQHQRVIQQRRQMQQQRLRRFRRGQVQGQNGRHFQQPGPGPRSAHRGPAPRRQMRRGPGRRGPGPARPRGPARRRPGPGHHKGPGRRGRKHP